MAMDKSRAATVRFGMRCAIGNQEPVTYVYLNEMQTVVDAIDDATELAELKGRLEKFVEGRHEEIDVLRNRETELLVFNNYEAAGKVSDHIAVLQKAVTQLEGVIGA